MTAGADFLLEVGTEELPPTALRGLRDALVDGLVAELGELRLAHGDVQGFASPRRLAVLVRSLAFRQPDIEVEAKGPPVSVAFDDDGNPRPPALAFAKKCGVAVESLGRLKTPKGEWLVHSRVEEGRSAQALLGSAVQNALARVPVPKPMRWADGDAEFVRPVHWVVMLHGKDTVEGALFGVPAGNATRGHRFHAPEAIPLDEPGDYSERLEKRGYVLADLDRRLELVRNEVIEKASRRGGRPVGDGALFDEVAALVEWPVAIVGEFDGRFLDLPREVVVATLTNHQRYFPVEDGQGALMPCFVTAANIESLEPERVRQGNERVIRPRLSDAAFFWDMDRRQPLGERIPALDRVVYQKGLGTIGDKSRRIARLAGDCAEMLGADRAAAERAGLLSKCDLVTGMVGEFPELQGTMGGYYAETSGEPVEIATAIAEHYRPRFAGDDIATCDTARVVSIADKLDTLGGVFCLGKKPSGSRDPFALRRNALGIVRTIVEGELDLSLTDLIAKSLQSQPLAGEPEVAGEIYDFLVDRLRPYAGDRFGIEAEVFEAVRHRRPDSLLDFVERLRAVRAFMELDEAASLAAANKRIGNILRQSAFSGGSVDEKRLVEAAERELASGVEEATEAIGPLIEERNYGEALTRLAKLRPAVDRFFDDVMVMAEEETLRNNRLGLLNSLRGLFLQVADISRLAIK